MVGLDGKKQVGGGRVGECPIILCPIILNNFSHIIL